MSGAVYEVAIGVAERDRDTVLGIWRGNLGHEDRMRCKFDWFYLRSPDGPPMLSLLRHVPDGSIVGVASAGPRRMLLDGHEVRAGLLVDLAVAASHRAFGPALTLQSHFVDHGRDHFHFLYGFPNPKAAPVFKRAGHIRLGELVRYVRVLRHAPYLARRIPARSATLAGAIIDGARRLAPVARALLDPPLRAEWTDRTDARFDDLWARSAPDHGLCGVRDAAFTAWRFDQSPLVSTRYLLLSDRSGRLRAWFACQRSGPGVQVVDFWSDDAAWGIGRRYVDALVHAAWRTGASSVAVEYAAPPGRLAGWTSAGFVGRERRPMFARALSGSLPDPLTLHVTAADEDE